MKEEAIVGCILGTAVGDAFGLPYEALSPRPAMRSALLGVVYGENPDELPLFVERTTRLTHTDPKAYYGALTVVLAAHRVASQDHTDPNDFLGLAKKYLQDDHADQLLALLIQAAEAATRHVSVSDFAESIGCHNGISGYINHTVPCVIEAWHGFRRLLPPY